VSELGWNAANAPKGQGLADRYISTLGSYLPRVETMFRAGNRLSNKAASLTSLFELNLAYQPCINPRRLLHHRMLFR
jgi:hypothetical protein